MVVGQAAGRERGDGFSWPHLPLVLLIGWWTLRMGSGAATWCFLDYVNLPFHEAGHLFFTPLGSTAHYLGGTILQIVIPAGLVAYFILRDHSPYAAALCFWWIGESLVNVGWYMADARALEIPLVGGGDHDWNELFHRFGLLGEESVIRISTLTHRLGVVVMLAGLAWSAIFVLPGTNRQRISERIAARLPWARLLLE